MTSELRALLTTAAKCASAAAIVGAGACFTLLDVLVLHDGIREASLTEIGQEAILFATAVLFWMRGRQPGYGGFGALTGGLFGCMFIRELDGPTDLIYHGIWKYPAWALAVVCVYIGWKDRRNAITRFSEFTRLPSFGMLIAGLTVILVYSRLIGVPVLWQGILTEGYVKTAKSAVEEGTETLGYCLCFIAVIDYLWATGGLKVRRRSFQTT